MLVKEHLEAPAAVCDAAPALCGNHCGLRALRAVADVVLQHEIAQGFSKISVDLNV